MKKKLSPRLLAIASYVKPGRTVADIGSDHAFLPLYLVGGDVCPRAIVTDVKEGPLDCARASVEKHLGYAQARFDFRLGDGLAPLAPGEADAVVIAGMGGETIITILSADARKAASFPLYILQPRTKTALLETWLKDAGWTILAREEAIEKGRACAVIVAAPEASRSL